MNRENFTARRVVITGLGVISSLGATEEEIMASFQQGRTTFITPEFDPDVIAAPVVHFDLKNVTGPCKDRRYLNRGAQLSVASALLALRDSGIDEQGAARAGLFCGAGPHLDIGHELPEIRAGQIDGQNLMALWILKFLPNTAATTIARLAGIHGENLTIVTACTASLQAIGEAFRKIKDGYLDLALAGGGDSRMSKGAMLAYKKTGALAKSCAEPAQASRPFDKARGGFVPGEGGAFFLLEERQQAVKRGAKIYGEIAGYGASLGGCGMTSPDPAGRWEEAAVQAALVEAKLEAGGIEVVAAHGTGTMLNDAMEAALITRVYGSAGPFVIALKSWIGHLSIACGAVELALSLIAMRRRLLPEIRNLAAPCAEGINFVKQGTMALPGTLLLENFGFGGQNSALIVKLLQ